MFGMHIKPNVWFLIHRLSQLYLRMLFSFALSPVTPIKITKTPESTYYMHASTDLPRTGASPFKALITIFYEPGRTFAALENRRAPWLPMIVMIVSLCALFYWFYSIVDFPWLQDKLLASMPAENRDMAKAGMNKTILQMSSLVGIAVGIPVMAAVQALYLMIVAKVGNHAFSFGKGFALIMWAGMPGVLLLPLGAMQILLASNGQIDMSQMNPVSLNQLIFQFPMGHKWQALLDNLSVPTFWSMALTVIGYQIWAKVPRATALKVVLIPYALIYGAWFLITLMSKAA